MLVCGMRCFLSAGGTAARMMSVAARFRAGVGEVRTAATAPPAGGGSAQLPPAPPAAPGDAVAQAAYLSALADWNAQQDALKSAVRPDSCAPQHADSACVGACTH